MKIRSSIAPLAALWILAPACSGQAPFAWKSVNLQGMGYVTGLVIHPKAPHDIYIRTDVGGAYRFDRGARRWLPLTDRADIGATGFESIAVDPTDANTVYGFTGVPDGNARHGEVFVSRSRGAWWQSTGLAASKLYSAPNDPYRGTTGEKLAVDPAHPGRLFLGTRKSGLWMKDGETPWQRVSAIPDSPADSSGVSAGVTFVLFDPKNSSAYAGVFGKGIYQSTDSGITWSSISSQVDPARAAIAGDGTLIVGFGGDEGARSGAVRRFRGGVWKDITPFSRTNEGYTAVAFAPGNPREVLVSVNHDQLLYRSLDQGDTWTAVQVGSAANQPGYYAMYPSGINSAKSAGWGNGTLTIDPVQPKRLLQTNGYGVIATEDYTAARTAWAWWIDNLEELVVQGVKVPPLEGGADLMSVGMDMVGFTHASRDAVPSTTVVKFDWVAQGNSIAYSAQHPESAAFVGWDETNVARAMTGYTSDNGKTWTPFASTSPGVGGAVALSSTDPKNLVWAPTLNAAPAYSTDGGRSWKPCKLTGGGNLPPSWQVSNQWWASQILAADPVQGGTFYYYQQGDIYSSTDAGATWSLATSIAGVQWAIKITLAPNPVKSGELWLAVKHNDDQSPFPLYRSTDGGKTFAKVPSVEACNYLAFGKGNSSDAPFVYIYGRPAGATVEAVYKSEDTGATWTRISDPAQQAFGSISVLEADMRTRDLVYVGTGGRGIFCGTGPGAATSAPAFHAEDVKNAAGYQPGVVAPGEIVTFWGTGIGPGTASAAQIDESGFISTVTGGTQVFFDGLPSTMIYASSGQTSAVAPYALDGRDSTEMQVALNGVLSPPVTLPVAPSVPAIFTLDSSGQGQAVAVNYSNGRLNAASNPARKGEYVILYVTGDGATQPGGIDGWPVAGTPPRTVQPVSAQVGGVPAVVDYAGGAPTFVMGVAQFNVRIPDGAPSGPAVPLTVTVGDAVSPPGVTIAIQ